MFCERQITLEQAAPLLLRCGLTPAAGADYTVGVFEEGDRADTLVATGSLVGDMLQMIAVDPAHQGEDLAASLLTHLINHAAGKGRFCLHLFTKPESVKFFRQLGFSLVAEAAGYTALLEWGRPGIREYCAGLRRQLPDSGPVSALVMNCNPFTLGHQYLVEQAAAQSERVVLFAVEEDLSEFPFSVRLALIRAGVAHLSNVTVIPGGRYIISSLTFPTYFSKAEQLRAVQSAIDAEIFKTHIAPALHITRRYVGTEPLSPTTAVYNAALLQRLPEAGIEVRELERIEQGEAPISASRVRRLLKEEGAEAVAALVPPTTLSYLVAHEDQVRRWVSGRAGD